MRRTFHVFAPEADGNHAIALVEDGVPKAMSVIPRDLFPPEDDDEAMIFTIAIIKAFGQPFPLPEEMKEKPWVG